MSDGQRTLIAERGAQMFPRLTDDELARLSKFGEPRSFRAGEMVAQVGETGPGLMMITSGKVEVTQHDREGEQSHIVTHERGNFLGELTDDIAAAVGDERPRMAGLVALRDLDLAV